MDIEKLRRDIERYIAFMQEQRGELPVRIVLTRDQYLACEKKGYLNDGTYQGVPVVIEPA